MESDQVARRVVEEEQSDNESEELFIDQVQKDSHEQDWKASLLVNNNMVEFKLDTGAQANVIPSDVFNSLKGMPQLGKTKAKLTGFNGSEIPVLEVAKMICKYKDKQINSDFFVVEAEGQPPLLGLRACQELSLIKFVRTVDTAHVNSPNSILDEFNDLFEGLGELEGEHHIEINPEVKPVIHPPRKVPFTLLPKLKQELERMEQLGAIEKVDQPTEWVNSIVIVEKPDGNLRICLDPKDLNRAVKREHFQLPTSTEITSKLTGAKVFSKLDAKDGFWHVKLDHPSSLLTTFNTPFGRFKFNRLPFGLNSSNEVFQKKMQFAFEGIEGAEVIYDDLLVWGRDEESHDRALRNVLENAREKGVKLKKQKCEIKIPEVVYIGDKITKDGIKPDESKIDAILNLPSPENKKDVERLLGMVTYLSKFIPNMSTLTEPLRALLKQDVQWHWEEQQEKALDEIKKVLTSKPVLCYYDVNKPVKLSVDASQSGLGAVLLQDNQPVAYASKSLTDCQKGYAQIEKETLAIVFGCERFHQYLYGKEVEIESDHKPLEAIFTKLPTTTQLLNAKIPTDARSQLLAQQKSQKLYFDRGAKALPPVKTGDAVRMKTSNGWRPATVTKLADSPRSVVVTSNGTLYRRNRRHIIKTPDVSKPTITSPKDDREITKSPGSDRNIIKTPVVTRSGRTVRAPRLSDLVYY